MRAKIIGIFMVVFVISAYAQTTPYDNKIHGGSNNGIVGKINDEFCVTPNGQVSYEIPIPTVAGTGGISPKLSIVYSSSTKDGLLGYGFDLTGLSIINRAPSRLFTGGHGNYVNFECDGFELDGNFMAGYAMDSGYYGWRTENNTHAKILSYGDYYNPISFIVKTKDGLTYEYESNTRLLNSTSTNKAVFWVVTKVTDTKGNYFTVTYGGDEAKNEIYPVRINYTGNDEASLTPYASVQFTYAQTSHPHTAYIYGRTVSRTKYLTDISIYYGETLVRKYHAGYTTHEGKLLLTTISERTADGLTKNPTKFTWHLMNSFAVTQSENDVTTDNTDLINKASVTVGDFNGDGKSDIIITPYHAGLSLNSLAETEMMRDSLSLSVQELGNDILDAQAMSTDSIGRLSAMAGGAGNAASPNAIVNSGWKGYYLFTSDGTELNKHYHGYESDTEMAVHTISGDFNGDGKDDFIMQKKTTDGYYKCYLYTANVSDYKNVSFTKSACIYSSKTQYSIQTVEANGDGAADLLIYYNEGNYGKYTVFYSNSSASSITPLGLQYSGNLAKKWDRVEFGDFNGDGLTDYLNFYSSGYDMAVGYGSGSFYPGTSSAWPTKAHRLSFGDLNGDGKTDILVTGSDSNSTNSEWANWAVLFAEGDGTFLRRDITSKFAAMPVQVFLADINGDGLDDIYAIEKTPSSSTAIAKAYIWQNDGTGDFYCLTNSTHTNFLSKWNHYWGDFTGDGKTDILCTANWSSTTWKGYKLFSMPNDHNNLLASITDGLGNTTEITYKYMSDGDVHNPGNTSQYPMSSFCAPWPVVSEVKTPDGIGGVQRQTYFYKNALMHKRGRGVLGFQKVYVEDEISRTETVTEYEADPTQYMVAVKKSTTSVNGWVVSEVENTNQLFTLPYYSTIFNYLPIATTERRYEYEGGLISETTSTYEYDEYGNVTKTVTDNGTLQTVTENTYSNTTYNGKWLLGRLTKSVVTKTGSSGSSTRTATFSYDSTSGLLTQETTEPYNSQGTTKTYVHDSFGNITQSTLAPNGGNTPARTEYSTYDAKGRFITSTTDALGFTTTNTIDDAQGLLLTSTDAAGITTNNSYDSYGRLIQSSTPIATAQSITGWSAGMADAPATSLYFQYAEATGEPVTLEFFDCLGRSVRKATEAVDGRMIYVDVEYNAKGEVYRTSEPYFAGDAVYWNTNQYDPMGRVIKQTAPDGSYYSMTYNGLTTSTTDPQGHTSTKVTDVNGNLVESTDAAGNSISYQYDVDGHCTEISGPNSTITMEYDLFGNKTAEQDDQSFGRNTYTYNAYGEVVGYEAYDNISVSYVYDGGGRLTLEQRPDMTVTTLYDTKFPGAVSKVESSSGHSVEYFYDQYGRSTRQLETIGTKSFNTYFTYNAQGHLHQLVYPSGLVIRHVYSTGGILTSIVREGLGTVLWQLDAMNARGQVEQEHLGNGLYVNTTYNTLKGYVERIETPGLTDWSYSFNTVGNLTGRTDNLRSLSETFEYDALDRLTTVKKNGQTVQQMTYDAAGNILWKSDVGTYSYASGSNRLLAVTAASYQPKAWDGISYTSFSKISHIAMGGSSLDITYGAGKQRVMAVQTVGETSETRYYVGNIYEEKLKNGAVTKINYIFAGGKAVAVFENNSQGTTLRYLHHDHLGSVCAYSDESGSIVQELSYDAWGRRRNPDTWAYYSEIASAGAWNEYGFTGHEHIDLFELVNMDGRMYDPVIGRFLSPDPIVQAPDYTQSLNRYSYCLNNPLSLVDPSGYSWFSKNWKSIVASAVGIAVSAVTAGSASGFAVAVIAGAAGGAAGALTGALLNGANIGQIAKSTFTGAFWGAVGGAANFISADEDIIASLFKHAFTEGMQETLQGGDMLRGFMMGLASSSGGAFVSKSRTHLGRIGCITVNAVVSGTISEIGGGKFANGAVTGAFSIMFNDFMHSIQFKDIDFEAVVKELEKLYDKYDTAEKNSELYKTMGGEIKSEVYDKYREKTGNACALKLSKALRKVGYFIDKNATGAVTDKYGNAYFVSAELMCTYLSGISGANQVRYNSSSELKANMQTGFFFQKGGYTNPGIGHIDAVYNGHNYTRLGNKHTTYVGISF